MKIYKRMLALILIIAIGVQTCACNMGNSTINSESNNSIKLDKEEITLIEGESQVVKVIGTEEKVEWSSDNEKIATVSDNGNITAIEYGTTEVWAKVGKEAYKCKVIVYKQTIEMDRIGQENQNIYVGETITLKAKITNPTEGCSPISWSSSNNSVAVVSRKGVVSAKSIGTTKIIAESGSKKVTFIINVIEKEKEKANAKVKRDISKFVQKLGYFEPAFGDIIDISDTNENKEDEIAVNIDEPKPFPEENIDESTLSTEDDIHESEPSSEAEENDTLFLNISKNEYKTVEKNICLSGTVASQMKIKSVMCSYRANDGENKEVYVEGTNNWKTDSIPLSAGDNYITITAKNDKNSDAKTIKVVRFTPELELEDNVIEIDTESSAGMDTVKDISDGILGVETNIVNDKEIISIAVTNDNPLYKYSHGGEWRGDYILYIPQNEYFISGLSIKYLYSNDNNTFISGEYYDAENCEILYVERANLDEIITEDNYMEYEGISNEDPIAFVSSPFEVEYKNSDDINYFMSRAKETDKNMGSGLSVKPIFDLADHSLKGFTLEIDITLYDQDKDPETDDDQIKLNGEVTFEDFGFDGKLDLPNECTGILEYTNNRKFSVSIGAELDAESLSVSEINKRIWNTENKISGCGFELSGADVLDDSIVIAAFGLRPDMSPAIGFGTALEDSKHLGIMPIIYVGLSLEGKIEAKASINFETSEYNMRGVHMIKKGLCGPDDQYSKNATISKEMFGYCIDIFDISAKSKEEIEKQPLWKVYLEGEGKAELFIGPCIGASIACVGIIPFYAEGSAGLDGKSNVNGRIGLSNHQSNDASSIKILDNLYFESTADFEIVLRLFARVKWAFEFKIKNVDFNVSYTLKADDEYELGQKEVFSLEGKTITGSVVDSKTLQGIPNAKVVLKNNKGKELFNTTTNDEGRFEKYVIAESFENLSAEVEGEGYYSIYIDDFSSGTIIKMLNTSDRFLDDFLYEVDGNKIILDTYKGSNCSPIIPPKYVSNGEPNTQNGEEYELIVSSSCFKDNDTITEVTFCKGTVFSKDSSRMFENCTKLTTVNMNNVDMRNVISMEYMFSGCSSLNRVNMRNIQTDKLKSVYKLFNGCQNLTEIELSDLDTGLVIQFSYMFYDCKSLQQLDLSKFDTSSAEAMTYMFGNCSKLNKVNVSNFNTENVIRMGGMFANCSKISELNLRSFNTSKVEKTFDMFFKCYSLKHIYISDSWDMSSVNDDEYMFYGDSNLPHYTSGQYGSKKAHAGLDGYLEC